MGLNPPRLQCYEFLRSLGTGGTADVFLYRENSLKRLVAVKVDRHRLSDADAQHRFSVESEAMVRLSFHPNILTIYAAGITADARSYLVLEYAPGGSLKEAIAHHPLTPTEVLSIGIDLCSALAAAHHNGILHRDLKPSNIILSSSGQPLVSDFGIASTLYSTQAADSFSLPWTAPEIIRGTSPSSEASDIYSLCATLFALLTGHSPYESGHHVRSAEELTTLILSGQLPTLHRADVPKSLSDTIMKGLAPRPEDRFATARELGNALQSLRKKVFSQEPAHESVTPVQRMHPRMAALKKSTVVTALGTAMTAVATLLTFYVDTVTPPHTQTVHLPTTSDADTGILSDAAKENAITATFS